MTNYIGSRCPVCEKKFVSGDDIVVCPICGAPHHRACYAIENHCAFEQEHFSGKPWKPDEDASPPPAQGDSCYDPRTGLPFSENSEAKTCSYCGSKNPKDNIFCCSCGRRLLPPGVGNLPPEFTGFFNLDPTAAIYGGVLPTDTIEQESAKDIATFVGTSSSYFLPRFKAIADHGGKYRTDFNFAALLFSYFYFFYRKMTKIAVIFLTLSFLLSIPSLLYYNEAFPGDFVSFVGADRLESRGVDVEAVLGQQDQVKIDYYANLARYCNAISLSLRMVMGLTANYFYYKHTLKNIKRVKLASEAGGTLPYESSLLRSGGVSSRQVLFGILLMMVLVVVCTQLVFRANFDLILPK